MRVALVCPYAWDRPGGVQSHVRSLAAALATAGHEVAVVAPLADGPAPATSSDAAFEVTPAGRTVAVPANGSVAPISFGRRAAAQTRAALENFVPDVVHVHEPLIPSISLLAVNARVAPAVGTFHAATESSVGYALARPLLRREVKKVSRRTAVSDAARALASRYFPGEYRIVPNGIDVKRFASAEPLDLGRRPTILFLGRVERRKGLEVLIQAVASLGDLSPRLVVVGRGPRERAARSLARRLQIDVEWLGAVDEETIPRLYRSADVFCAPNLGGESFGIVLLEAMAAGTRVVCSDLDAFRSVAGDAATFARRGDPRSLSAALRGNLGGERGAGERVEVGRRRAEGFDWSVLVDELVGIYREAAVRAV